jgi:hypothetical protein
MKQKPCHAELPEHAAHPARRTPHGPTPGGPPAGGRVRLRVLLQSSQTYQGFRSALDTPEASLRRPYAEPLGKALIHLTACRLPLRSRRPTCSQDGERREEERQSVACLLS